MHVRSIIEPPETFDGRKLSEKEREVWSELADLYGPFVVGDRAGCEDGTDLPTPLSVSWCALYPLAIYLMSGLVNRPAFDADMPRPRSAKWIPWDRLLTEFWNRRDHQLKAFQMFLADWNLRDVFGTPPGHHSHTQEVPWNEDRKVLGMHRFRKWDEVVDYALRWKANPNARDTHLWQHRSMVSRGIDLICSELLANGFEHSGTEHAEVFIMAKLCSHESAWGALQLHEQTPYLSEDEVSYFTVSSKHRIPTLQICIGDSGQGFGGNQALRKNTPLQIKVAFTPSKNQR